MISLVYLGLGLGYEREKFMMKMKIKKKILPITLALSVVLLTACAAREEGESLSAGAQGAASGASQQGVPVSSSRMETEEQLREALAALGNTPDGQEKLALYEERQTGAGDDGDDDPDGQEKLAIYEELLARDLCREEDYREMARLYAGTGDAGAQRRILWWALHLYPSEEYARQLQELVVGRTPEDEAAAALIADLQRTLEEQDAPSLRGLIEGEGWAEAFQEAPEIYATRTRYTDGSLTAQVTSDAFETEVCILTGEGVCLYGRINDAGSLMASAPYADGAYNGAAAACWFDAEDILYKRIQTTLRGDICVDSVSVEYEGASYTGALGEDGATLEPQQDKVTEAGGVVYAYQVGGSRYLYQENTAKETFRMDCTAVGLPHMDIWE